MTEQRKFDRIQARLDVEIRVRGRGQTCSSVNVSRHGMYLATPNPPEERQLLILRIPIPDGRAPIDVMASVVRRAVAHDSRGASLPPGMGINFFALTEENKGRWESYLGKLKGAGPAPSTPSGHGKRPTFLLQPKDVERLKLFVSREFALRTMFLKTPVLRDVGEIVNIVLLHPTTDEEFPLLARVQKVHTGGASEPKGMTLDLDPVSPDVLESLQLFVAEGVGPSTPSAEIVPEPAPEEAITPELAEAAVGDALPQKSVREIPPAPMFIEGEEPTLGRTLSIEHIEKAAPAPAVAAPKAPAEISLEVSYQTASEIVFEEPEAPTSRGTAPPLPAGDPPAPGLDDLRAALAQRPQDVVLLFRLGSTLARQRTTAFEAIEVLQRLLALEPHHPLANGPLAMAYAHLGQKTAAQRHLARARRLGQPIDAALQSLLS